LIGRTVHLITKVVQDDDVVVAIHLPKEEDMKIRQACARALIMATSLMATSAHAVVPVIDVVNATSNIIQNVQLKAIKKSLSDPKAMVVNNTTHIDNSTKEINKSTKEINTSISNVEKYTQINMEINKSLTWIINKESGDEIIPVPRDLVDKLEAIHGKDPVRYVENFKDAAGYLSGKDIPAANKAIFEGSRARKAANDMLVDAIELEQAAMGDEMQSLKIIKHHGEDVAGHGRQLQVANALSMSQINQMMKLRSSLMVSEAQRAAEAQVSADRDARAIATSVRMRDGLDDAISGLPMLRPVR
jgi:conjugal transfer/entry exclusion protein